MPFKCTVNADKTMIFSGSSRLKFWRKDQWGDWEYLEQEFIEHMGFTWLDYDGEEGRGLWGGPVWTDGTYYWTYGDYALRSFLEDLKEEKRVECELSEWEEKAPNVRWVFADHYEAERWLRKRGIRGIDGAAALAMAQNLSDEEFNARS